MLKFWGRINMLLVICIFFLLLDEKIFSNAGCMIRVPHESHKFKVFLEGFMWRLPQDNFKEISHYIPEGQAVEFYCENGFVDINLAAKTHTFVCQAGKYNGTYYYEDLLCKSNFHKRTKTHVISNIQLGSDIFKCEGKNREVYQVGIEKLDGYFKPLYRICFDKNHMKPKFVYQPPKTEEWEYEEEREVRWDVWGFDKYGDSALERLRLTDGYVTKLQSNRIASEVFGKHAHYYPYTFTRGHMATFSHYMKPDERRTTCLYINAVPQLKELNKYTWNYVESEITELMVAKNPFDYEIYTGPYGIIPTFKGSLLFLSTLLDPKTNLPRGYVPIPKLIWKYVRHVKNERHSKVYVGVNNPEFRTVEDITSDYLICKPLERRGKRIRGSAEKGFVYECHVKEFLKKLAAEERIIKIDF